MTPQQMRAHRVYVGGGQHRPILTVSLASWTRPGRRTGPLCLAQMPVLLAAAEMRRRGRRVRAVRVLENPADPHGSALFGILIRRR